MFCDVTPSPDAAVPALRVTVVDDDDASARALAVLVDRYAEEQGVAVAVVRHADGAPLVDGYDPATDLVLLDVEMPGIDGLTAARLLRERDHAVSIVLTSHAAAHAVRGYQAEVQDFLVKPVGYADLRRALDRAVRDQRRRAQAITLDTGRGRVRLDGARVLFVEAARRRVVVHTLDGQHVVHRPLKTLAVELGPHGFARSHHSYLVNLRHVVSVRAGACGLVTRRELPVSRSCRATFLAALTDAAAR